MSRIFGLLIACTLLGLTACASSSTTNWTQTIATDTPLIAATAQGLTTAGLGTITPVSAQQATAQEVYTVATVVAGLSATAADFTGVDTVVAQQLQGWNSPYAPMVTALFDDASTAAAAYITQYFASADAPTQLTATRTFMNAFAVAVENGALPYCGALPVALPAASHKLSGTKEARMRHLQWLNCKPTLKFKSPAPIVKPVPAPAPRPTPVPLTAQQQLQVLTNRVTVLNQNVAQLLAQVRVLQLRLAALAPLPPAPAPVAPAASQPRQH